PDRAGQFQSGDDHDRPGSGGRNLYRADHARDCDPHHRKGAQRHPRRLPAAADQGRPDRAQLRTVAAPDGDARQAQVRDARRERYQDQALIEALQALDYVGLPAIIRPSFTLGGTGGGIAYNKAEFLEIVERGLDASPTNEILIEESVLGWKEFEMEVVRDKA